MRANLALRLAPTLLLAALPAAQLACASHAAPPGPAAPVPTTPATAPDVVHLPPVTPRTLYLEPVHVWGDSRIAFWEETWPLEDAVARFLTRPIAGRSYEVVPPAVTRALIARMRAGLLPDRDARCEPLPAPGAVLSHHFEEGLVGDTSLSCNRERSAYLAPNEPFSPGCTLHIRVAPIDRHEEVAHFEAHFPLDVSPSAIVEALDRGAIALEPAEVGGAGGLGLLGTMGDPDLVTVRTLDTVGAWDPAEVAGLAQRLGAEASALATCEDTGPRLDHWANDLLLEIDPKGRVIRCEPELADRLPEPESSCRCAVIRERLTFAQAAGPRRMRLDLFVRTARSPSPAWRRSLSAWTSFRPRQASDPTVLHGSEAFPREEIDRCLGALGERVPRARAAVTLRVDGAGRVIGHAVTPIPGAGVIPEALEPCVARALSSARFTCPFSGAAEISGTLELELCRHADSRGLGAAELAWLAKHDVTLPTSAGWFPSDRPAPGTPLLVRAREGLVDAQGKPVSIASLDATGVRLAIDARLPARAAVELLRALGPGRLVYVAYRSTDPNEGEGSRYLLLRRPERERDGADPRLLHVAAQRLSFAGGRSADTTGDTSPVFRLPDDTTSLNQLLAVANEDDETPFATLALAMEAVARIDRLPVPILVER